MDIDDLETLEQEVNFPYPSQLITLSDSRKPCQKWEDALKDEGIKKLFNEFSQEDKTRIQKNLKNRECQNIKGSLQCVNIDNQFEPCSKMPHEIPNNIKAEMKEREHLLEVQKKTVLENLDQKVENFRKVLSNLIQQHQTRQDMKSMSLTYKETNQNEVGKARTKQSKLGDQVEKDQKYRDLISGKVKNNYRLYSWYDQKNDWLTLILKLILWLMVVVNLVFLMTSKYI